MNVLAYLMAAYAVFWGGTFLFVFSMYMRQAELSRRLRMIEELLEKRTEES